MLIDDAERGALKEWVVPKLEKISDADAGVLADYVIALIVAEETEEAVKQNCLDSLRDFLQDHTAPFIDEVLDAVKKKSFLPNAKPAAPSAPNLLPSPALSAEAPPFNPPTGPSASSKQQIRLPGLGTSPPSARGDQSRKRRYNERETSQPREGHDPHYRRGAGGDRPTKQLSRRGGWNNRGGFGGQDVNTGRNMDLGPFPSSVPAVPQFSAVPALPPGFPPFDLLSMMSMGFPGLAQLAGSAPTPNQPGMNHQQQPRGRRGRCTDYDTKGYCALGSACPYDHGGEIVLPPSADGTYASPFTKFPAPQPNAPQISLPPFLQNATDAHIPEYDPNQASLAVDNANSGNGQRAGQHGRSQNSAWRGRARAPFSQPGPTNDRSNTTVVVEQIPEENFSEEAVRGFFSQFGNVVDVNMQAYKRLAIVKFDDHFAARRAYDSPKVVFDNRFVKVYWYKPESLLTPPANKANGAVKDSAKPAEVSESYKEDEEMLDTEEVEKRQAEAQKAFEERQKKAQEAAARNEEVQKQIKEKDEQMKLLKEKLAQKSSLKTKAELANGKDPSTSNGADMIDQLSSLQAEAQDLNADFSTYGPPGRGRGGYRGRGYFPPRARGYSPFRGGYRGRGFTGAPFAGARSAVKRWDNRPKRVAISGVEAGSPKDEALRQHLLNNYEYDSIDRHPDRADTQIITFKERYVAEMFLDQASDIPDIGKVELAWVPNAATVVKTDPASSEQPASEGDIKMEEPTHDEQAAGAHHANGAEYTNGNASTTAGEADYDVADDEDRWMAA